MGTVEHEHAREAAEEHPVRVGAQLHGDAGAQDHEHWTQEEAKWTRWRLNVEWTVFI